ncbi:alpha/beta hydrolase [Aspergillus clavatus NRRL 1]|uniref:Lipase/esterase, putative n=1 Tax=Aspergillus clavatus (strain ATCC 1007 / CBS 513.65 / DSM 816 / NCTC 3887 / NRRL 1 / QM 1276 / 107) TaxID=344612 RepID=A1CKQ6_ASPCL|nr:lipase/esterase, putative [Aspergillus clavatus NRRL 1]EAW09730.1 lipase/esterase, putative [Aspergillus clavatus NRRL 1]
MSVLDGNPVALLKAMLVRLPLILKTVLLHGVQMSPVSGKQDLRTELTVAIIRSFINLKVPVGKQQKSSMRDPGIKGPMWVSKVTLPQPEDDVQDAVIKAIEDLKDGDETYDIPGVGPVEAVWTAYRRGVDKKAPQPDVSEEEKYRLLRQETQSDMAVLYFHGGAYFLMDPCTHRVTVSQLSKHTGAPVLSVRYRLAPQHPFPAALVDALVAYLSLLAPPPGSLHEPVPANKIILAGDSAGGNLSLALLQTLLTLRRISPTVRFHGQDVRIELPAGATTTSPWCDLTRSMPSVFENARYDFLDPPIQTPETTFVPLPIPEDDIWPCSPPRGDFFANATAILHPLVSPLASRKEIWKDSPPVFMSIGEEGLTDEGLLLARKMHQVGVPVVVEQFEGMPHCFGMVMDGTPASQRSFKGMADFCRDAVAGRVKATGNLTYIGFKLRSTREIPLERASTLSDEEVDRLLRRTAEWRLRGEEELQRQWSEKAKL